MHLLKLLALVAVTAVLMTGVFALAVWLGAGFLTAVVAAGLVGGLGRYALYQWLEGQPLRPRDALVNAGVTAAIGLASGILGEAIAPALASFVAPVQRVAPEIVAGYVPKLAGYVAVEGVVHGPMWSGAQVVDNVATGRRLTENTGRAFEVRAITFPVAPGAPVQGATVQGATEAEPAPVPLRSSNHPERGRTESTPAGKVSSPGAVSAPRAEVGIVQALARAAEERVPSGLEPTLPTIGAPTPQASTSTTAPGPRARTTGVDAALGEEPGSPTFHGSRWPVDGV